MVKFITNPPEDYVYSASGIFEHVYEDYWLEDKQVKQMVKDIDKTELISPHAAYSPILGSIPITYLSGGVLGLILVKHYTGNRVFSSTIWGDDCAEWLCRLSFEVDFSIVFNHFFNFCYGHTSADTQCFDRPICAMGVNGEIFKTAREATSYKLNGG